MSLNRYRLRHRANEGSRGARLAETLLARPDRLIGLILLLSTSSMWRRRCWWDSSRCAWAASFWWRFGDALLTFVLLIFCEVAPKTFGALHPGAPGTARGLHLHAAAVFAVSVRLGHESAGQRRAAPVRRLARSRRANSLSSEELRTVVAEAGAMIPRRHQQMLVSILDLENATVEDIMVPRNEIVGIDVDDDWDRVIEQLRQSQHTRLPVYRGRDRSHHRRAAHEAGRARVGARAAWTAKR